MSANIDYYMQLNWSNIKVGQELQKRLFFTLGALAVYRFCTFIQIPGLTPAVIQEFVEKSGGGFLAMFDAFAGGSLSRNAIMFLGLSPYITSSIIMQIASASYPYLKALAKEGEAGQQKKNQYIRYLTLIIASIQAYTAAIYLETLTSSTGIRAVLEPGLLFRLTAVLSVLGGTFLLMWLGEQITSRGLGQGSSMIIYAGIIANMPGVYMKAKSMYMQGIVGAGLLWFNLLLIASLLLFVAFVERSYRQVPVQYPKGQMHTIGGVKLPDTMPVKLNVVGVMAPIFAGTILGFTSIIAFLAPALSRFTTMLNGSTIYYLIYSLLLVFFVFEFSPIVFNPEETSENLRKNGSFIPGYRPGEQTTQFFKDLLHRLGYIGSLYLLIVCVLPEMFIRKGGLHVFLGGTSLLIVIGVTYELVSQVYGHILTAQYKNMFKNNRRR